MAADKLSKEEIAVMRKLLAQVADEETPDNEEVEEKDIEVKKQGGEEILVIRGSAVAGILASLGITEETIEEELESDNEEDPDADDESESEVDEELSEEEDEIIEDEKPVAKKKVVTKPGTKPAPKKKLEEDPKPPAGHPFFRSKSRG